MREADLVKPVQKFVSELEKAGGKPLYELTPQEARQVLREVQKDEGVKPEAKIEEIKVPLDNGREMRVLIVRPADVDDTLPVVFYIHGGGWVMGDETTHDRLIRQLAMKFRQRWCFRFIRLRRRLNIRKRPTICLPFCNMWRNTVPSIIWIPGVWRWRVTVSAAIWLP